MPDAWWGIFSGIFSGLLGTVAARLLSTTERRQDSLRASYELLMKRVQQLEKREGELETEVAGCRKDNADLEEKYFKLERKYYDLLRENGNGNGGVDAPPRRSRH